MISGVPCYWVSSHRIVIGYFDVIFSALRETLNTNPKQMRDQIMSQCVSILACYRKNCSNQSAEGQLILPEAMKLLPLYSNCVIKSAALQGW